MVRLEVFDEETDELLFGGDFPTMPRTGETISKETPLGYFKYYTITSVWYREDGATFQACVAVKLDD